MKFQVNIYKPDKKSKKKIKAPKLPGEPSRSHVSLLVFVGALLLILLGSVYLYMGKIATLKRRTMEDQKQIGILQQYINQAGEDQNKNSGLEVALARFQDQRVLWKDKLVELSRLTPDAIRLTWLSLDIVEKVPDRKKPQEKVKETVLTIKGETLANPGKESLGEIARFIVQLNASPVFNGDFESIALVDTHLVKAGTGGRELMEFELSGSLQRERKKG
jgi:Tfp pilus assembly protein PilN